MTDIERRVDWDMWFDYSLLVIGKGMEPQQAVGCRVCGQASGLGPRSIEHAEECPVPMAMVANPAFGKHAHLAAIGEIAAALDGGEDG